MFKPFFVHYHRPPGRMTSHFSRGFTIRVTPDLIEPAKCCRVQVTFCSNKDQFNKKEGRETVKLKAEQVIQKRMLPKWVSDQCNKVLPGYCWESDYHYLYKYLF